MSEISSINFSSEANNKPAKPKKVKKEVVYVSKTPEAAVNATGVIAGTGGMLGGAVLGGLVGVSKLPGEYVKQIAGQNYSQILQDSLNSFKSAIVATPELKSLGDAIRESKSPAVAEEIMEITKTLSNRLHSTFASDPHASAVLDKVVDPFINGLSIKKNIRSYGSSLSSQIKSPIGQTILKFIGFNKKTSKIVGDVTGNIAEGITKAVENLKNLTPQEQEAWKKVLAQISEEFEHNPKIKLSKNITKALKGMLKNLNWINEPIKNLQKTIIDAAGNLNNSLGKAPIKTIGIHSAIGAGICGTISLIGWFGLKKGLMNKEVNNKQMID